jgi:UDP-glucose 4-epimerase
MKIVITGGAGFVGSNLADELIKQDHQVFIIDNLETGRLENINRRAIVTIGDISDNFIIEDFISKKPDVVVHAAASYKDPDNWMRDIKTNVIGTAKIVEACKRMKVNRLIYFQTSLCYGEPRESPITLNHPICPQNSYAITKTAGEQFISTSGLDFVSFRLCNVYGPRNTAGAIPAFYKKIKNNGTCVVYNTKRDFIYIDDLLDYVIDAIKGKGRGFYHISTGKETSIKKICETVFKIMNKDIRLIEKEKMEEDVSSIYLDPSKTFEDFGNHHTIELEEGIRKAIEWYNTYEIEESFTHLPLN